jgi:hypothetical protein
MEAYQSVRDKVGIGGVILGGTTIISLIVTLILWIIYHNPKCAAAADSTGPTVTDCETLNTAGNLNDDSQKAYNKSKYWQVALYFTGLLIFMYLWDVVIFRHLFANSPNKHNWLIFTIGLNVLCFVFAYLLMYWIYSSEFWRPSKCSSIYVGSVDDDGTFLPTDDKSNIATDYCNKMGCGDANKDGSCGNTSGGWWGDLFSYISQHLPIILTTLTVGVILTMLMSNIICTHGSSAAQYASKVPGAMAAAASEGRRVFGENVRNRRSSKKKFKKK